MLLSMLMLLYVDDLVLLAPSRSDLTTALEELERITRRLCSAGQVFRSLKANMFSSSTESGSWGTQPASVMNTDVINGQATAYCALHLGPP